MFNLEFTGTGNHLLYSNGPNIQPCGSHDPPWQNPCSNTGGKVVQVDPYHLGLNWEGNESTNNTDVIPRFLNSFGGSFNSLIANNDKFPIKSLTITLEFQIKQGHQSNDDGSPPKINLTLWGTPNKLDPPMLIHTTNIRALGSIPVTGSVDYVSSSDVWPSVSIPLDTRDLTEVQFIPWNDKGGASNYPVGDFVFNMVVIVKLKLECNSTVADLTSGQFCSSYCLTNEKVNLDNCLDTYLDFCFAPTNRIFTDVNCQTFIENHIQTLKPSKEIDTPLTKYCTDKYDSFQKLFESTNGIDPQLCACHMTFKEYGIFGNQVLKDYSGLPTTFGINDKCLLPQCSTTPYKSASTHLICNVPACLNITIFNLNGTYDNNKVTINNHIKGCTNVKKIGGTGTGNGSGNDKQKGQKTTPKRSVPPDKTFLEKYRWYIVVGIIVIVLLFIIIVAIMYFS